METLTFTVSPQEFEYIMNALAQRPFIEVNQLLSKLVTQANNQVAQEQFPPGA